MSGLAHIELIAFDMFGTLVRNDASEWRQTMYDIAVHQRLPVDGDAFWAAFAEREVAFRKRRTNMANPDDSPPFKSYWEAWRDAFIETFSAMGIEGDADAAASCAVDALCDQDAFPDTGTALRELGQLRKLAVLSNADDRYLDGTIAHNGWRFARVMSSEGARAYKPDPRIFERFLGEVGLEPEAVLYVGDSPYDDAHGAKLAGMRTVLVQRDQDTPGRTPPPNSGELLEPDYVVGALTEIPGLLA